MNRLDPPDNIQPSDEALDRFWRMASQEDRLHANGATAITTPTTTSQSGEGNRRKKL